MHPALAYLPPDRLRALAGGNDLPSAAPGAVLSADMAGFTRLTEELSRLMGVRRGADHLALVLNRVYEVVIAAAEGYGGSVVSFSGDALRCWFAGDSGHRAVACGQAMHTALAELAISDVGTGERLPISLKVAVAAGMVQRLSVGDPATQRLDVLAGPVLTRLGHLEALAGPGELIIDQTIADSPDASLRIGEWRVDHASGVRGGVVALEAQAEHAASEPAAPEYPPELAQGWLDPAVWQRLMSGQGEFLTELRPAVALFGRFGERDLTMPGAREQLDALLRWIQGVVARLEGSLIQVTLGEKGNYIYAAFGAPIAHEDDMERAVLAARELAIPPGDLADLGPLHIGVAQGVMRTGAYGSSRRRTYGVLGDGVNLAARLMSQAAPGQILANAAVREATRDSFAWEALPAIQLKGKNDPVGFFALAPAEGSIRSRPASHLRPMIGRTDETVRLREHVMQARVGSGRVVAISGEAGVGKSRLVATLLDDADQAGLRQYQGDCVSYGANTPYLPWQPIWRAIFGLSPDSSPEVQIAAVSDAITAVDPLFAARAPLLGPLLGLAIPDTDLTRGLEPQLQLASREALLVDYLRAWLLSPAAQPGAVIVLEDMHWSDALSQSLAVAVSRVAAQIPLLLVLVHRRAPATAENDWMERLELGEQISLETLSAEETALLVTASLRQVDAARSRAALTPLAEQVFSRTQGNPFFVDELLAYLVSTHTDITDPAIWASGDLPLSLHSLILSRLDRLSLSQQQILKVASIIGRLFQTAWLPETEPGLGDALRLRDDLGAIEGVDLIRLEREAPELAYLFKHVITQEVTYESLAAATRATLHERLAVYLEAQSDWSGTDQLYLLAHHYARSTNRDKARDYLERAGDAAAAAYANDAAARFYRQLLDGWDDGAVHRSVLPKLGAIHEVIGRWDEAEAVYRQLEELSATSADDAGLALAYHRRGRIRQKRGEFADALEWLERARSLRERAGDPAALAETLREIGFARFRQGDFAAASTILEPALALAQQLDDPSVTASILTVQGNIAEALGDRGRARDIHLRCVDLYTESGNNQGRAAALNNLGKIAYEAHDLAGSSALLQESLEQYHRAGDKQNIAKLMLNIGVLEESLSGIERSTQLFRESLAIARDISDQYITCHGILQLALALGCQGNLEQAEVLLYEALAIARRLEIKPLQCLILNNLGDVLSYQDKLDSAETIIQEALALSEQLAYPSGVGDALTYLGYLRIKRKDYPNAQSCFQRAITTSREAGLERNYPWQITLLCLVMVRDGRPDAVALGTALLAAVKRTMDESGDHHSPDNQAIADSILDDLRAAQGEPAFASAWAAGAALPLAEAVHLALAWRGEGEPPAAG